MVSPLPSPPPRGPTLNDVVRSVADVLGDIPWLNGWQRVVLGRIADCGTGDAGYVQLQCDECRHAEWAPMGCHDRHCPSCDFKRSTEWQDARVLEAIDAPYFHYVFTVPGDLYPLMFENQIELYNLFFEAASDTIKAFAQDPKFLGGTPAFFNMLHTTNRQLGFHPHLHSLIAGVALDETSGNLKKLDNPDFLFPARQLASGFRGRFLSRLKKLYKRGRLSFQAPKNRAFARPGAFYRLIGRLFKINWNIRTDRVEGNPIRVIRYLARYTHRTAISNARIIGLKDNEVTFTTTSRKLARPVRRTLHVIDFIKLFSRHILPKGFKRVRFYGLLSPSKRAVLLPRVQAMAAYSAAPGPASRARASALNKEQAPPQACSCCGAHALRPVAILKNGHHINLCHDARPIPPPRFSLPTRQGNP